MDALAQLTSSLASRYRIERELGAGGMAVVYLAHDLKHDRKVALKVLRPELSAILGGERFLKEIRTTANLQHPHILPLHDSGEADGLVFYVMPYVEGESLRERLRREKQLPVDDAIKIAREVASALDYAHRHGVVHRDIKPENILLHDGQAQVADFGIALAASRSDAGTRMTETGMSLGTPHYMAPEQAMGEREVTPKADIYALGCVLYEMLVGEPPFNGPTPQAIIARVLTDEPRSLTLQRKTIPPHIEAAVQRALEKLPADRFASAAQFADALTSPSAATIPPSARAPASSRRAIWRPPIAVSAASIALAVVIAGWSLMRQTPSSPLQRFGLALSERQTPISFFRMIPSPNGAHLVYVGRGEAGPESFQLWIKPRDRYDAAPLAGTLGVFNFTYSPDGQWLAFVQDGRVRKLPIIGGAAITLADTAAPGRPGIAWLDDGTIVYIQRGGQELRRIADMGGPSTVALRLDSATVVYPSSLPGGRGVLFVRCRGTSCVDDDPDDQELWVLDVRSGKSRRLLGGVAMGQFVPTGHIVYARRDGAMLAIPFNLRSLEIRGSAVPVLDSVAVINGLHPLFDVSRSGTLVFRSGASLLARVEHQMVWVDRSGRETPIDTTWTFRVGEYTSDNGGWSLSPDGRRLAIGLETDAGVDVWIKQLPTGPLSRVTFDIAADFRPRWMPDGRSISFISRRGGRVGLYRTAADGTGGDAPLVQADEAIFEGAWAGNGKWLVVRIRGLTGIAAGRDIFGMRPAVDSTLVPLVASRFEESAPAPSPDGRWIAYESDETGRREVYVRPFPNTDSGKWQVSTNGGFAPLWARSGRELFYMTGSRDMVVTRISSGPTFGARQVLFRLREDLYGSDGDYYTPWDITPDGQRFVMARRVRTERGQVAPLIIVENWLDELRQKTNRR